MRDPYSVLGVRRNAGPDEIKAAWRSVAKSVHPDQNRDDPTATSRFAEAGRAYEVLKDPKLRNRYDQARREADLRRMEEMARKARSDDPVDPETADEMISRIFAAESKVKPPEPKQTEPKAAESKPAEPKPQATKQEAPKPEARPEPAVEATPDVRADIASDGKGDAPERSRASLFPRAAAPAAELVSAIVRRIRGGASRPVPDKVPDIFCEVTVSIEEIFRRERPTATLPDGQTLKVTLPGGTTDGSVIRLKEQGYRLNGLLRGDLVVNVRVLQHGPFRTEGLNLRTTLPISLQDAVLGGEATVTTLTGAVSIAVPAWSGSQSIVTLAGHGLPTENGGRGDLLVELRLMLREKPDEKLIDLMLSHRNGLVL